MSLWALPRRSRSASNFCAACLVVDLAASKLVISDAHEVLKATAAHVPHASWQSCRANFLRNPLAHAGKGHRRIVAAWVGPAFVHDDADAASKQWHIVGQQLRPRVSKLARLMEEADMLAFIEFSKQHGAKIDSTNPPERLNAEIKRRTNVAGILPNETAIVHLIGTILLEQNHEWAAQRRYMSLEILGTLSDTALISLRAVTA